MRDGLVFVAHVVAGLRAQGFAVPVDATLTLARALTLVDLSRPAEVRAAARATLLRDHDDAVVLDRALAAALGSSPPPVAGRPPVVGVARGSDADDLPGATDHSDDAGDTEPMLRWSRTEVLRDRDFASLDAAELAELASALRRLRLAGSRRPTRRPTRTRRRVGRIDVRRTLRETLRTDGETIRQVRRSPSERARPLVILCDVSGSMEPYARALMVFAHAAVRARGRVEVFTIGTYVTRVTRALRHGDVDAALARASAVVPDWSGGTRLGAGIADFVRRWGAPGRARGADVVIASDGWDRGDPEEIAAAMARLRRLAHRVVWVNPLHASEGYAPTARGMAAALPYVDELVAGHSLGALEDLAAVVAR